MFGIAHFDHRGRQCPLHHILTHAKQRADFQRKRLSGEMLPEVRDEWRVEDGVGTYRDGL